MNIKIYFLEIKNRLLLLILSWLFAIIVSYIFKETLFFVVIQRSITLELYDQELSYFIFTDVSEIFRVYIVLIFFVGNQIFFLCFLYHGFVFTSSGLYCYEYFYILFIGKTSLLLFGFSVLAYNAIIFPFSWNFFLSFQNFEVLNLTTLYFESKISEYLSFYVSLYYVCVFYFQSLVVLFIVFNFLNTKKMVVVKSFRKVFYYFFVLFSTLITPPDIFSQLCISLFLVLSYEILVFYFIFYKKKEKATLVR